MSAPNGEVNITITDGALGNVTAPPAKTQVVIGNSSAGSVGTILSTTNKAALVAEFGYGKLVEAAALVIDGGGTVIATKLPDTSAGTNSSVTHTGTGASVMTLTGSGPFDDYDAIVLITASGTVGTGPWKFKFSLDGGRTYGPEIRITTAATYDVPQTGITLNFTVATVVVGDTYKFTSTAPIWGAGDVTDALTLLSSSTYTWGGGIHLCGPCDATDAGTFQTALDALATDDFRYTFMFIEARDFESGDTDEAGWMTALESDFAALDAKRICAGAGMVNITSPIKNPLAGAPNFRRPLTWAAAKRAVQVPPHVHLGRVRDGALTGVTGPGTAALAGDGFIYHDERVSPGLDAARFMAARTIVNRPGVYVKNPNLMSPPGSDFSMLMYRQVMDIACSITHDILENYINDNVRLDPTTGFILEKDARHIEAVGNQALRNNLLAPGSASDATMVVSRDDNLNVTKILTATVRVLALGYILEVDVDVGFANPQIAA